MKNILAILFVSGIVTCFAQDVSVTTYLKWSGTAKKTHNYNGLTFKNGSNKAILDCDREIFEVSNTDHFYIIDKEKCIAIKNKVYSSTIGEEEELFIKIRDGVDFEVVKFKKIF